MSVLWLPGNCPKIPVISDERLSELMKQIRTVVRDKDGVLKFISPPHPRKSAFTWSPKFEGSPKYAFEVGRIETHHACGYIACFKPSIAEVLAQIPERMLPEVEYFETLTGDTVACYAQGDGHRTVTILYSDLDMDERLTQMFARSREQ